MIEIKLGDGELKYLHDFVSKGQKNARERPEHGSFYYQTSKKKIQRSQKCYVLARVLLGDKIRDIEESLQSALEDKPRPGQLRNILKNMLQKSWRKHVPNLLMEEKMDSYTAY
jgi:hypothetical protein